MAAPRVSRRLRLDDEEEGPAPSAAGAPDSARDAEGGEVQPAVLGPMAGAAARGGRRRLDPQPRAREALAPIRGSRRGQAPAPRAAAAGDSDSGPDEPDSAGQPEAKPGSRRREIRRPASQQAAQASVGRPTVQIDTVGQPRESSGVTQPANTASQPESQTNTVRSSDSKFLSTLDSHRPYALPDEKYGAEAKV